MKGPIGGVQRDFAGLLRGVDKSISFRKYASWIETLPSLDLLIAFLIAASIFAYMPGPSTLYAAAQTIARGRRAGWYAALGIHLGGYVHVFAAAVGLAFLFQAVPTLYLALKLAGATYLIWLGILMYRSQSGANGPSHNIEKKSATKAFWESVSVEVLNPKTAIFLCRLSSSIC